jgi:TonB family protein
MLVFGFVTFSQSPTRQPSPASVVVLRFVAPPYPRAAKDNRMMGTTVSELSVALDGSVSGVRTIRAHKVFESSVASALRQWRFKPINEAYKLQVTVSFEFAEDSECTNKGALTPETSVSADLPSIVHIKTGLPCVIVQSNSEKQSK